jgi:hypothetical protein
LPEALGIVAYEVPSNEYSQLVIAEPPFELAEKETVALPLLHEVEFETPEGTAAFADGTHWNSETNKLNKIIEMILFIFIYLPFTLIITLTSLLE